MKLITKNIPLSNIDIETICKQYSIQLTACLAKDMLDELQLGNYIINLNNANQSGSHWVLLVCQQTTCYYQDSFGAPPPQALQELLQTKYKKIPFNNQIIQDMKSVLCGFFCIAALIWFKKHRLKPKSLVKKADEFIDIFHDSTSKNDKILSAYLKKNTV
jgi:hypothetical protein